MLLLHDTVSEAYGTSASTNAFPAALPEYDVRTLPVLKVVLPVPESGYE